MRKSPGARLAAVPLLFAALAGAARADDADPGPLLARIKAVRAEGAGNAAAARAWKDLVAIGPKALFPTLAAFDGADPVAANWIRAAADAIADRAFKDHQLSAKELEQFVLRRRHSGAGRRIAYEWLVRLDPSAPRRLLPGMLDEPGAELRRDAVAVVLAEARGVLDKGDRDGAALAYRRAFDAARDDDQVEEAAKQLKALGKEADLAKHYGCVRRWMLVTPFDNTNGVGFAAIYPPEKEVDLAAAYKGKGGAEARWLEHTTTDPHGLVDLNKALGKRKAVVAYAYAVVESPREQKIELRAGCMTAIKVYLNGKQVFGREEYHHGINIDQHVAHGTLKAGRNEILVKVCQNDQSDSWAQDWQFQLRLCDAIGGAVPFKTLPPKEERAEKGKVRP